MKRSHLCALLRRPLTEKLSIASYSPLCLTALFPPDCYQRVRQGQESDTASLEELLLLSRCCVVLLLLRSGTRRHCSMADTSLSGGGVLFSSEELACFFSQSHGGFSVARFPSLLASAHASRGVYVALDPFTVSASRRAGLHERGCYFAS